MQHNTIISNVKNRFNYNDEIKFTYNCILKKEK